MKRTSLTVVLLLISVVPFAVAETSINDSIFVDLGLGMNYSVINQTAFLTPKMGLEFLLADLVMTDLSIDFETHSADYSGIQKNDIQYFTIDLLGKYFLDSGLWMGAGFGYAMFLNSSTVNAAPATAGELHTDLLRFMISLGYLSEILDRIYLNPSLLLRVVVPTEESGSFDFQVGLYFTTSLGIMRRQ